MLKNTTLTCILSPYLLPSSAARCTGLIKKSSAQCNALSSSLGSGFSPCSRSAPWEPSSDQLWGPVPSHIGRKQVSKASTDELKKKKKNHTETCARLWELLCANKGGEAVAPTALARVCVALGWTRRCPELSPSPGCEQGSASKGSSQRRKGCGIRMQQEPARRARRRQREGCCDPSSPSSNPPRAPHKVPFARCSEEMLLSLLPRHAWSPAEEPCITNYYI